MIASFIVIVLAIVGAIYLVFGLLDSLWSVLELVASYLMPYFLPAEVQPLWKKFGPWAGIFSNHISIPTDGFNSFKYLYFKIMHVHLIARLII